MEQYQVITRGQVLKEHSQQSVIQQLQRHFTLSEDAVKPLLCGKPISLRTKLSWQQAKQFQEQVQKMGLLTHLQLQLNPECLKQGLVPIHETSDKKQGSEHYWLYNKKQVASAIYASKQHSEIHTNNDISRFKVKQYNGRWNAIALIFLSVFVAYILQNYFLRLSIYYLHWSTAATILSLLLLVSIIVLLPKLAQLPL
ncbi:hypothetical protein JYU12_01995, partial [bacterium AH-315-K03]|nr:hypothetical protein [bacterium AH-315-K03]